MIDKIKKIIEFAKTKKGKASFFFGFYTIFFLCLFLFIGTLETNNQNHNNNNQENNPINNNESYYQTKNLENSDYSYKITIQENDDLEILDGNRNNNENINNYKYREFVDLNELKRIIKNAKYLSKSLYSENIYKVNYQIKNNELAKLFDKETDNEEINNLVIITNEVNDLIGIELDFSNYLKIIESDISIYRVLIDYEY